MKKFKLTTKVMLVLVVLGLTFTGCSTNESDDTNSEAQDYSEVALSSEIDEASAALEDFIIEVYEGQEASESRQAENYRAALPDCVTVTVVMQQGFRQITVDFGSIGCTIRGHVYQGQIVLTYERDIELHQVSIGYTLNDFYFDDKNILGSNSILRQLSNANENPQFTHTVDLTVIWPNGAQASRDGEIIREWIEGFGSGIFSDNVFEVTGFWNSNFVNGNSHSYEIMVPLRREVICYYFVSGTVDVERTNFGGVFNFGAGDCDNQATFTFNNGTVVDIVLR